MTKYSIVFPGQGAQKQGMGMDLLEISKEIFDRANNIYPDFQSILQKTDQELSNTLYSQPALYVVSCAIWLAMKDSVGPAYLAGHSVGEYAACYAAGCFSFEDGLRLIKLRSELMAKCSGIMFACIANFEDVANFAKNINDSTGLVCEVSNHNLDSQIIISCDERLKNQINQSYKEFGIKRCIQLKVSGGFHSSLVESVQKELAKEIEKINFNDPKIAVISNKTGEASLDGSEIKNNLIDHVTHGVKWKKSMDCMKDNGVEMLVEMGCGNVLSKLAEKSNMKSMTIGSIDDILCAKKEFLNV
ncbi:ACP S-malonyltransferase [Candidatus Cytomitobacter indipagum]|uniref:Malonyl CoA-acyl carrier protein transacylase n=1 Tax=Candidatus Cytomitobacter indipagum TaxID=2601575 RepID=A0A5C0UDG0_9PROT|nr:ACP S-malonyltransferase [Candidatus Cytomitobacter indipagum]QEK38075.1 ACP S-malonyltransferase [Candidatus Cytomitobacter indipagum]